MTPKAPQQAEKTAPISHAEKNKRGRYWIETEAGEAELTYQVGEQGDLIVINSTFVPVGARGGGVAFALVLRAIEDARAAGRKIDPVCPYVDLLVDRNPEWRALRAGHAV